jgi:pyridine nucleotide-disulfide oxidoreductase family protein
VRNVLLAGAGHAHASVLASIVKKPLAGLALTLASPQPRQIYSGMLPGVIAGHYRREEAEFDVAALAARAGARFVRGEIAALDLAARAARLQDGSSIGYDVLSLDVGSLVDASLAGAEHALPLKPFERLAGITDYLRGRHVAVVGGGAAGVELAMAMRHGGAEVSVYAEQRALGPSAQRRLAACLRRLGVSFIANPATSLEEGPVVIAGSSRADYDLVVLAAGAVPLPWLRESGLATDARGFVLVDDQLRSTSHREVFAVGDCASSRDAPQPKSGVFAVRHGALLEANLRHIAAGAPLRRYRPQRNALLLLSCGGRYAIAERGGWSAEGRWVWWWKNAIDRRWLRRLRAGGT